MGWVPVESAREDKVIIGRELVEGSGEVALID